MANDFTWEIVGIRQVANHDNRRLEVKVAVDDHCFNATHFISIANGLDRLGVEHSFNIHLNSIFCYLRQARNYVILLRISSSLGPVFIVYTTEPPSLPPVLPLYFPKISDF